MVYEGYEGRWSSSPGKRPGAWEPACDAAFLFEYF